jgi:uncharacterized protein (UPF0332 family)
MIKFRLEIARSYLDDAMMLFKEKRFNSAASRAYYASYQAMWAALGGPKEGRVWRHLAIIKHFVRGYWFEPGHEEAGPGLLEDKRLPLRRLYSYRIISDYEGKPVDEQHLGSLLETVRQVIRIIDEKRR